MGHFTWVRTKRLAFFCWVVCGFVFPGCVGYRVGRQALYRPDIQTVHVPVFTSESFRRHLGEWLTEAVSKEIERSTPYKVVGTSAADSVLQGRITSTNKRILSENVFDEPSELETDLVIQIQWLDRRGVTLIERTFGIPDTLVTIMGTAALVPDAGQSIASAEQEVMVGLAAQIVGQMEMPW